jgi:hypothetical protein
VKCQIVIFPASFAAEALTQSESPWKTEGTPRWDLKAVDEETIYRDMGKGIGTNKRCWGIQRITTVGS